MIKVDDKELNLFDQFFVPYFERCSNVGAAPQTPPNPYLTKKGGSAVSKHFVRIGLSPLYPLEQTTTPTWNGLSAERRDDSMAANMELTRSMVDMDRKDAFDRINQLKQMFAAATGINLNLNSGTPTPTGPVAVPTASVTSPGTGTAATASGAVESSPKPDDTGTDTSGSGRMCVQCQKPADKPKRCGGCRSPATTYCSAECQRLHWTHHKPNCQIVSSSK